MNNKLNLVSILVKKEIVEELFERMKEKKRNMN